MMIDNRLRDALRAHSDDAPVQPPWEEIEARAAVDRRHASARRLRVMTAIAAAVAVVLAAVAVNRNSQPAVRVVADDSETTTTEAPSTTTAAPDPAVVPDPVSIPDPATVEGIYPDRTAYERDGVDGYREAESTATAFARDYLGMPRAVVTPIADDETRFTLRPNTGASLTTTLRLTRVGEGGPWTVTDARASQIRVGAPMPLATVTSPLSLRGEAQAYEGHVEVQVREDGMRRGESIGSTFVIGAGDAPAPFDGRVTFRATKSARGAVVFFEPSAEDGSTMAATVVRVHFGTPTGPVALSDESVLRLDGVGPVAFGMTIAEARAAAKVPMEEHRLPGCVSLQPVTAPRGLDILAVDGDRVRYAIVKAGPIRTDTGIGVGDRESKVLAAHPRAEVRNAGEPVHRVVRYGEGEDRAFAMIFEIQDGAVQAVWSGPRDAANTDELCS